MKQTRKSEKLYDSITDIRDNLVTQAQIPHIRPRRAKRFAAIAAILAITLIAGVALWPYGKSTSAAVRTLAKADYPNMAQYPNMADYAANSEDIPESGNVSDDESAWTGNDSNDAGIEPESGNISDGSGITSGDPGSAPESDKAFDSSGTVQESDNGSDGSDASDGSDTSDGTYDTYMDAYDAWWEDVHARRSLTGYDDNMYHFLTDSTKNFLSGATGENLVYSPLNVYIALGMLAELTDGNSRQQILDLLGTESITSLRKQAYNLWNAHFRDDGLVTSILASSLWLNKDVGYRQSTIDILAKHYYASSYQGEMGSSKLNTALQNWLEEQAGGLLKKQASNVTLNPDTVLALATTLNYKAQWNDEFSSAKTKKSIFHADSGDVTCDFMHRQKASKTYYWGEKFSAISEGLEQSGSMWFLLPDEGVTADDLLNDNEAMSFLLPDSLENWKKQKTLLVNQSIPKFDVSSQFDLKAGLEDLGVTDVFHANVSDFSPLSAQADAIHLSQANHAGRVTIDEKGVTAASYTVIDADTSSALPPDKEIDFVLDRPFLFAVTDSDGLLLFAGIVNLP